MSKVSPDKVPSAPAMNWLLIILGAIVMFGLGRWSGESSRISQLEQTQQQLRDQIAAIGGGSSGSGSRPAPPPAGGSGLKTGIDVAVAGASAIGRADAPVTLIEFSDFQCPFCGRYVRETLPRIKAEYVDTGKIRYVFRHYPIDSLHPQAVGSAHAAVCAEKQGKFWPMHDRLFANPRDHSAEQLRGHASAVGLNLDAFATCLSGPAPAVVSADIDAAVLGGAMGTPAFFIGSSTGTGPVRVTHTVYGAKPFEAFKAALDSALQTVGASSR